MDCPIGTVRSRIFRAREAIDLEMRPLMDRRTNHGACEPMTPNDDRIDGDRPRARRRPDPRPPAAAVVGADGWRTAARRSALPAAPPAARSGTARLLDALATGRRLPAQARRSAAARLLRRSASRRPWHASRSPPSAAAPDIACAGRAERPSPRPRRCWHCACPASAAGQSRRRAGRSRASPRTDSALRADAAQRRRPSARPSRLANWPPRWPWPTCRVGSVRRVAPARRASGPHCTRTRGAVAAGRASRHTAVAANTAVDPFSGQRISLTDRPWPRALLPASPARGSFNVDYGTRQRRDAGALSVRATQRRRRRPAHRRAPLSAPAAHSDRPATVHSPSRRLR